MNIAFFKDLSSVLGVILSAAAVVGLLSKLALYIRKKVNEPNDNEFTIIRKEIQEQKISIEQMREEQKELYTNEHEDVKRFHSNLDKRLEGIETKLENVSSWGITDCRNTIVDIYYKNLPNKKISYYEKKIVSEAYDIYTNKFKQNSYIHDIHEEICKWEII